MHQYNIRFQSVTLDYMTYCQVLIDGKWVGDVVSWGDSQFWSWQMSLDGDDDIVESNKRFPDVEDCKRDFVNEWLSRCAAGRQETW